MKSKTWLLLLLAAVLIFGAVGVVLLLPGQQARYAEIASDGQVLCVLDLQVDQTRTVESKYGTNEITVSGGKIAVTQADCPDHYCVRRGYCDGGAQIVCLPNRLVIRFLGEQALDGVVG